MTRVTRDGRIDHPDVSPDGRRAGSPLSEGISPVQGADRNGPTAVVRSAAKIDHLRTGGTLLNVKFTPEVLAGDKGLDSLVGLILSAQGIGMLIGDVPAGIIARRLGQKWAMLLGVGCTALSTAALQRFG